jgi:hypothetical protein
MLLDWKTIIVPAPVKEFDLDINPVCQPIKIDFTALGSFIGIKKIRIICY